MRFNRRSLFLPLLGFSITVLLECRLAVGFFGRTESIDPCPTSTEWITVFHYLQEASESPSEDSPERNSAQIQEIAQRAASGCRGAADRFIRTDRMLEKLGVDSQARLGLALARARGTDAQMEAFRAVLSASFARDLLDLDVHAALQVTQKLMESAERLSLKLKSDRPWQSLPESFPSIARLCSSSSQGRNLSPTVCARITEAFLTTVLEKETWESHFDSSTPSNRVSAGERFVQLMSVLTEDLSDHLALPLQQAFELGLEVLAYGEFAGENWRQAFVFAARDVKKGGLGLSPTQAKAFAFQTLKLAQSSTSKLDQAGPSLKSPTK